MRNLLIILLCLCASASGQQVLYESLERDHSGVVIPSYFTMGSTALPSCVATGAGVNFTDVETNGTVMLVAQDGANAPGTYRCTSTGWQQLAPPPASYVRSISSLSSAVLNSNYNLRLSYVDQGGANQSAAVTRSTLRTILGFPTAACASGQVLKGNGSTGGNVRNFDCLADATGTGAPSAYIQSLTSFTNSGTNLRLNYNDQAGASRTLDASQTLLRTGVGVPTANCSSGQIWKFGAGGAITCQADATGSGGTAGVSTISGITLSGTSIRLGWTENGAARTSDLTQANLRTAVGNATSSNVGLYPNTHFQRVQRMPIGACSNGQVLKANAGGNFTCQADATGSGGGATNLSVTRTSTAVTVASSTGTDATIPGASSTAAGALVGTDFNKLARIPSGACASGQILKAGAGGIWSCQADATGGGGSIAGRLYTSVLTSTSVTIPANLTTALGGTAPTTADLVAGGDEIRIMLRQDGTGSYTVGTIQSSVIAGWTRSDTWTAANSNFLVFESGIYELRLYVGAAGTFRLRSVGPQRTYEFIVDRITRPNVSSLEWSENRESLLMGHVGGTTLTLPIQPATQYWNFAGHNSRFNLTQAELDGTDRFWTDFLITSRTDHQGVGNIDRRHRVRFEANPAETYPTSTSSVGLQFHTFASTSGADTFGANDTTSAVPATHIWSLPTGRYDIEFRAFLGGSADGNSIFELRRVVAGSDNDVVIRSIYVFGARQKYSHVTLSDLVISSTERYYFTADTSQDPSGQRGHYVLQVTSH